MSSLRHIRPCLAAAPSVAAERALAGGISVRSDGADVYRFLSAEISGPYPIVISLSSS